MTPRTTREVDGYTIVTSGNLVCPSPLTCDKYADESMESYIRRHAVEHELGTFESAKEAERNLGVWCFLFFHKYVWGNPELHPFPHWEIHAFISEPNWDEDDLQHTVPLSQRKRKGYLAPFADRKPGTFRRFKQVEVPRQCQKTSIGARAYPVFRALHEYFVNGRRNYRQIIRSATAKNARDTLAVIRRMATKAVKLADLYGVWQVRCLKCGATTQQAERATKCPRRLYGPERACTQKPQNRRIALVNTMQGSGATGADQISFRWLTDSDDVDAVAAYSIWVAGLGTETTGQRPDRYTWDDVQTEKNSDTFEKREAIHAQIDGSVRELQFDGELILIDTRKYVNDFGGAIGNEPLVSLFYSLRREVRWRTDEPDNAPWVVDGWRYYYPVKGNGQPALDAAAVKKLMTQMLERGFSAEYMNDPLSEATAKFKREHFKIVGHHDTTAVPPEIRYGLGQDIAPNEQRELDGLRLRVFAINGCDPSGDAKMRKSGDETFIVALRLDRHGRIFVTRLACGRWGSKRIWDEIEKVSTYNLAQFTDYEMPASEVHIEESLEKWIRDRSEALSALNDKPVMVRMPIRFTAMPKSGKESRIDQMEMFLPLYILDDAAEPALIEKYISQWIGRGSEDHDDGPDATSRLLPYFTVNRYKRPEEEQKKAAIVVDPESGAAQVPLSIIKNGMQTTTAGQLWGQQGHEVNRVA